MRAMVLEECPGRLVLRELPVPEPGPGQVQIKVKRCAVCRTDLHLVDGELPDPKLPVIPGHEVVGEITALGNGVSGFKVGERVGVPWLGWTCGNCFYCKRGQENLCPEARFTGYTLDGGYAEYLVADARYAFRLPDGYGDAEAAPLLCAGLIGYRTYSMAPPDAEKIGIYGFGAAGHIIAQVALAKGQKIYAFTRPGDEKAQKFALEMGVDWAGGSDEDSPEKLDAALIFAPVGPLVVKALKDVRPGGVVVCGGIYMTDIPSFEYGLLWEERIIRSVANLTRKDGEEFLKIAGEVRINTKVEELPLEEANTALDRLREGQVEGALVLVPESTGS